MFKPKCPHLRGTSKGVVFAGCVVYNPAMLNGSDRARALLSVQRALLGSVTHDLRAVSVRCGPITVAGRFVYDADADLDGRLEIVREVETLVIADHDDGVDVEFVAEAIASSDAAALDPGEVWAFLRKDGD